MNMYDTELAWYICALPRVQKGCGGTWRNHLVANRVGVHVDGTTGIHDMTDALVDGVADSGQWRRDGAPHEVGAAGQVVPAETSREHVGVVYGLDHLSVRVIANYTNWTGGHIRMCG